jgi:hypothetical protein
MLKLKLLRLELTEEYTEGVLINENINAIICDTLEDRVRDINADGDLNDEDEGKVYGETAIPYGSYSIKVTWSPKFKRNMVLVEDVPHFSGIRMHWARTAKNLLGCIGVGEKYQDGKLRNSNMTNKLVELLMEHGNEGQITIE